MAHKILFSPAAARDLERLSPSMQRRVDKAVGKLANNPRPRGSKKLEGHDHYRLRVGDYRILYDIDDGVLTVLIIRIRHRKDVYRRPAA